MPGVPRDVLSTIAADESTIKEEFEAYSCLFQGSFITSFRDRIFIATADLIRTSRIRDKSAPASLIALEMLDQKRIQKPDYDAEKELKVVDQKVILCIAHSNVRSINGRRLVAVGTNENQIHVFEYFSDNNGVIFHTEHIVSSVIPKAPTSLAFDSEDAYVIVGDRSGDVHRFSVLSGSAIEMPGAASMIPLLTFSQYGKRLIMVDRNQKIRMLHYPPAIGTEIIILENNKNVMALAVERNSIWTVGGDKVLYSWSIADSKEPRRAIDLSDYNAPIRKISINLQNQKIAVLFEKRGFIIIADIQSEPAKTTFCNIDKESEVLDVTSTENNFILLGRNTITLIDVTNYEQKSLPIGDQLAAALKITETTVKITEDAENLAKNVTHNNQEEYEEEKAEECDQIEKKRRRVNNPNDDGPDGPDGSDGPSTSSAS